MTVFIQKGDKPLSVRQGTKRGLAHFNQQKQQFEREQGIVTDDPDYLVWAAQWVSDNAINAANNLFNHQLAAYRKAVDRLAQYALADGRPEQTFEEPTGQYDEEGSEVMHTWVQAGIDALPATIEQNVYDEAGELTGTETVANPLIVADDAERAAAQAVIDGTPAEVVAWL